MTALFALLLLAQIEGDNKPPDAEKINRAIDRGTEYLLQSAGVDAGDHMLRGDELVLFAIVHAGKASDSRARKLLDKILKEDMNAPEYATYNVSLRAMALEKLDPVKYQIQIAQAAWWLVNAQTDNGLWDYWSLKEKPPSNFAKVEWPGKQATGETTKKDKGLLVKRTVKWADRPPGIPKILRNVSTAQYATLGLYAAFRAKVWVPEDTWKKALEGVLTSQSKGGGWGYIHPKDEKNDWDRGLMRVNRSMTSSQLAVLAVLKAVLDTPPREIDAAMDKGFKYLAEDLQLKRMSAMKGPTGKSGADTTSVYWFYFLYSVERAGILWGKERIGDKWWYAQGANELLRMQNDDGSWGQDYGNSTDRPAATAFAILFLKRAVPPPVATGGKASEEQK